jgi:hypothetical protein
MSDYLTAVDGMDSSIWKLEAIADMFSVMSNQEKEELCHKSFYGISLFIRQETESIKKDKDTLLAQIRTSKA